MGVLHLNKNASIMRGVAPHISMKFFFTFEVTQSDKKHFFDTMSNLAFQVHLGLLRHALPFSSPHSKPTMGSLVLNHPFVFCENGYFSLTLFRFLTVFSGLVIFFSFDLRYKCVSFQL